MSPIKKVKNTADGSTINAGGKVSIGDRTTINQVFNMDATQGDLDFFTKFYMVLIAIFAIAMLVLLFYPWPKNSLFDYLGSFAAGGFFALGSLILVFFLRSKQKSSIPKIVSDEI
ncbi:MAG: hypothetical protein JW731_16545 [Bacteroidales bacterium]|nr:hypothetical protein [Bacteroidales bacterium]